LIYSAYEKSILRQTAEFLPKFKTPFNAIIQRCKDLASPFQKRDVVHPDFEGSYSIKYVLPALVPGMSYTDLPIGDGTKGCISPSRVEPSRRNTLFGRYRS
jgi:hypothetical protein